MRLSWPPQWWHGARRDYILGLLIGAVIVAAWFAFTGHGDWAFYVLGAIILFILVTLPEGRGGSS